MPFLWEAVKTPEGHTYYYNSRQPLPFFWGFGGILMRSMLYIAEYECLRWRFVVVDGSISRDPGLDILRLHDQQFHPGPKTNKIQNFIDFHPIFPGITQTFPEFSQIFQVISSSDPPGPPNSLSAVRTRESTWERPLALGGPMAPWHPRDIPSET